MVDVASLKKPIIETIAELKGIKNPRFSSEDASAFGAMSCWDKKTSIKIFNKFDKKFPEDKDLANFTDAEVFTKSIGKGHLAVFDPAQYVVAYQDLPRICTLFLCEDQYRTHLQQSLRRVDIEENDLFIPESLKNTESGKNFIDLFNRNYKLYKEMTAAGIHKEIARGVTPLYLTTAIQTTSGARGWWHAFIDGITPEMPSIIQNIATDTKLNLEKISPRVFKDREQVLEPLYYFPASQLFWPENESLKKEIEKSGSIDNVVLLDHSGLDYITEESMKKAIEDRDRAELANLKHAHMTFLWPMTIYTFHQVTRQKTLDQSVESIYDALERKHILSPLPIANSEYADEYMNNSLEAIDLYAEGVNEGHPAKELVGYLPHDLVVFDKLHINGWNAVYMVGLRACKEAQGEVNGLAKQTAKIIKDKCPPLGQYSEPRGVIFGECPEDKWDDCGYCKGIVQKREKEK